uniref:Syndecan n=1 Tax=Sinocyclocheilus grahami TaxID=75366 RepID=A0A672PXU9_SINGR
MLKPPAHRVLYKTLTPGGVIGFLFAIFLILLLVYRMRKKDEGSYDLGERKHPNSAYQKAPSKEFYA